MSTESEKESGFLSRWSRRKLSEPEEEDNAGKVAEVDAIPANPEDQEETEEERANREAAEAIDLEELTYESDFSLFMKTGVPLALRNAAMRKLWTSNPILANVDGLAEYDDNYADPALNVFKSAWEAGRGYLKKELEADPEAVEAPGELEETDHDGIEVETAETDLSDEKIKPEPVKADVEDIPEQPDSIEVAEEPARISIRERLKG